jgi:hypothetical protein
MSLHEICRIENNILVILPDFLNFGINSGKAAGVGR